MSIKDEGQPPDMLTMTFIGRYIRSVGHLEALLYLYQHRHREWTPQQLSNELRTNASYARQQMNELAEAGLLTRQDGSGESFRYEPIDCHLDEAVSRVATMYRERKITVINTIYASSLNKIQSFADAFKLQQD